MRLWSELRERVRTLALRSREEREMDDELAFHLEMESEQLVRAGLDPAEARRRAHVTFGGAEQVKEEVRDARGTRPLEQVAQELRNAMRALQRAPAFATTAVLSLVLGIGATTTMFAVVDAVDLRPLPFADADRLVTVREVAPPGSPYCREGDCSTNPSMAMLEDLGREARTLDAVASYPLFTEHRWNHGEETETIDVVRVPGTLFALLGARPILGRSFATSEHAPDGEPAIVISHDLWTARFEGKASAIGRRMAIIDDNRRTEGSFTIIGVMPKGFRIHSEVGWLPEQSPKDAYHTRRDARFVLSIARLAPGRTISEANAELRTIAARLSTAYPETNADWSVEVRPLDARALLGVGTLGTPEQPGRGRGLLLGVVAVVLVIATLNVAALSLVRGTARARELGVRKALGASRARLAREALSESLVLALVGGSLGTLAAVWGVRVIAGALSLERFAFPIVVDLRVTAFAFLVSALTGVLIGVLPVLRLSTLDPSAVLRGNSAGGAGAGRRLWPQRALVAGEVASALVLVTAGALLGKELYRLRTDVPGYDARNLYQFRILLSETAMNEPDRQRHTAASLLDQVRAVPGIGSTSLAAPSFDRFRVPGRLDSLVGPLLPIGFAVGPEFFRTTGTRIVRGRAFDVSDRDGAPSAVIVDETAAGLYWPGEDPVGKELAFADASPDSARRATVVGVAAPARLWITPLTREVPYPYVYRPIAQTWSQKRRMLTVFARLEGEAALVLPPLRAALRSVSGRPVDRDDVQPMERAISAELRQHRFTAVALGTFALVGLLLAVIGIYGLVAFTVVQRTREVGIRMALGADRSDILRLVMRGGLTPAVVGIVIGAYAAFLLTRLLRAFLVGTSAQDPWVFALSAAVILLAATAASILPARRATRIEPAIAFRAD